ncbi:spherulation-specific family 4 protein [Kineosporia babensis]|uniref:Spherulation-specific family 4 protein n=1 Tax=Kineosporia babensis TaxID=499548 RepID=A0A9X1NAV0_9ACTN|nr:spherulation-specific family 4 protein [Kineosporia babensis]MCD5310715.1 spherulation-specific family 4 protein [Kineosporia babensis]
MSFRFRRPRLLGQAVPMYVHPVLGPDAWQALGQADLGQGFAVVNAANGPGTAADSVYEGALGALSAPVVGYADYAYGGRGLDLLLADLENWRRLYGITGLFLDQVTSHPQNPGAAADLIARLRDAGATRVIVNPGVEPAPMWCQVADVVVSFEGSWAAHQGYAPADWLREIPAERLCHLVHSVPSGVPGTEVAAQIMDTGAGIAGVSHEHLPNPWTGALLSSGRT